MLYKESYKELIYYKDLEIVNDKDHFDTIVLQKYYKDQFNAEPVYFSVILANSKTKVKYYTGKQYFTVNTNLKKYLEGVRFYGKGTAVIKLNLSVYFSTILTCFDDPIL